MDRLDRIAAEYEALRTVKLFYQLLDAHDHSGALALMAENVVWFRQGVKVEGRAQVRKVMSLRSEGMKIRHLVLNDTATAVAPAEVQCCYCVVSYRHDGPPGAKGIPTTPATSVFDCTDRLRQIGGFWRFAYKDSLPVFAKAKAA